MPLDVPDPQPAHTPDPSQEPSDLAEGELRCSRRGCHNTATWALTWNNPSLHTPDRRKTWLACDEHREYLSEFLSMRDFLRDTKPL